MNTPSSVAHYHVLAVLIVVAWAITFISTKVLLLAGMTAAGILVCRFAMAYVCLLLVSLRGFRLRADSWRDELLFFLTGFTGCTIYYMAENSALNYTYVSNVALICCTTPLITLLLQSFFIDRKRPARHFFVGSLVALLGVALVVFNGNFVLRLSPVGDVLCVVSALSWSVYTLLSKRLGERYSSLFITRKVFFYGLVTIVPFLALDDKPIFASGLFADCRVALHLVFLGFVASFLCFLLWNVCLRRINTIVLSNYIYMVPVISIFASNLILDEALNAIVLVGAVLILSGMYYARR